VGILKYHTTDALLWAMTDPIKYKNAPLYMDIGQGLSTIIGDPRIATWNNAGRPPSPKKGTLGYNFETKNLEYFTGAVWMVLAASMIEL